MSPAALLYLGERCPSAWSCPSGLTHDLLLHPSLQSSGGDGDGCGDITNLILDPSISWWPRGFSLTTTNRAAGPGLGSSTRWPSGDHGDVPPLTLYLCQRQGKESLYGFKRSVCSAGRKINRGWRVHINTVLFMGGCVSLRISPRTSSAAGRKPLSHCGAQPAARGDVGQTRLVHGPIQPQRVPLHMDHGAGQHPGDPLVITASTGLCEVLGAAGASPGSPKPPSPPVSQGERPCNQPLAGSRAGKPAGSSRE